MNQYVTVRNIIVGIVNINQVINECWLVMFNFNNHRTAAIGINFIPDVQLTRSDFCQLAIIENMIVSAFNPRPIIKMNCSRIIERYLYAVKLSKYVVLG